MKQAFDIAFRISPREPWVSTGIELKAGHRYRITSQVASGGEAYMDKSIPCSPDGPESFGGHLFDFFIRDARFPLNPAGWGSKLGRVKRLRVLKDREGRRASFLTLIAALGKDDREDNVYVIGSGHEFTAHASEELFLFANDWPGGRDKEGDGRFYDEEGNLSETYGNNRGELEVTVKALPQA